MARVTHVRKAQQRFHTRPVIDPETGEQKRTPVMRRRKLRNEETGEYEIVEEQKKTKTGRLVFMDITEADKSRPKPNLRCDYSGCQIDNGEILPGSAYKWIAPKSGPYGGTQRNRHEEHPSWQVWEYSSSMSARLAQISFNFWEDQGNWESPDDVQSALDSAADEIRSIAEEKRESAGNIEDGFGHPTSASEELEQIADDLDGWADDVSAADIPELPEPEDRYFIEDANGGRHGEENGYEDESEAQANLDSMVEELTLDGDADDYTVVSETPDEPSDEQMDAWREEVQDAVSIIDESPV